MGVGGQKGLLSALGPHWASLERGVGFGASVCPRWEQRTRLPDSGLDVTALGELHSAAQLEEQPLLPGFSRCPEHGVLGPCLCVR